MLHASLVEPMETVALCAVLNEALEVSRTARLCPLVMAPPEPHAPPAMETCGLPVPETSTAAGQPEGMPLMETVPVVVSVEGLAFVTSAHVKAAAEPLPYVPVTPSILSPQRMLAAVS